MIPVFGPSSVALGSSLAMSSPPLSSVRAACMIESAGASGGASGMSVAVRRSSWPPKMPW